MVDCRDLGQVLTHVHDAKIEIVEMPMPPREPLQSWIPLFVELRP
jgi:hypothetical protein